VVAALERPVTVIELSDSGLIRNRWVFSLQQSWLILDRYYYERRYATTQEFRVMKFYDRLRDPSENYGDWQWLEENDVPWDEDLQGLALTELLSRIQVVRQSDTSSSESALGAKSPSS
jgi:hypothetical protein